MDEVEVEVVYAQVRDGLFDGGCGAVGAVVGVPELGGDPDVFAGNAGGGEAFAGLVFVSWGWVVSCEIEIVRLGMTRVSCLTRASMRVRACE